MIGNRELLIVDDERTIRDLYANMFRKLGFQASTVGSAEEAIEFIRDHHVLLFFLDLNLPGMDGVSLCRVIRNNNPMAVCYAVTGYASLFQLADCRDAGFEDFFIKPVSIDKLVRAAEVAFEKLDRWRSGDGLLSSKG